MQKLSGILVIISLLCADLSFSQCTPINCLASLPSYGGICETAIADGQVNQDYYDSISFHITTNCIDGALLGEEYAGTSYKVTSLHSFQVFNLPNGMTAATNQPTYTSPANGCAALLGTPTEAGVFLVEVNFMVNTNVWLFSSTCSGFLPPVAQNDNLITTNLDFVVLPDPSFTGTNDGDVFCLNDEAIILTAIGTPGGLFSGAGVVENTFNPALAGTGTHQITYTVTAQEGNAIGPSTNSMTITVEVLEAIIYYADSDGDGYGNPDSFVITCLDLGVGWVMNGDDCDDDNPLMYPNAEPTGTGLDNNCDGVIDDAEAGIITSVLSFADTRPLVFPNPTKNVLNVRLHHNLLENQLWNIVDLSGRSVLSGSTTSTGRDFTIDVNALPDGLYLLRLQTKDIWTAVKFAVAR